MGTGETINRFGIGTDIESIDRFDGPECLLHSPFLNKIFTASEQEYCFSRATAAPHLAARFAGKEAVIKALASLGRFNIGYKDIEIINNQDGVPEVAIGKDGFGDLQVKLSLSHCRDNAIAFAVAIESGLRGS
jgi:holo-[acyl-carrier protein] synthase